MAFKHKLLTAKISLASGNFGDGGNTVTLSGLRMSAKITYTGSAGQPFLDALSIFGMPLSQMNQLAMVGVNFGKLLNNKVQIQAGEEGGQMSTVFQGTIQSCFIDGQSQPEVCLRITANPSGYNALKPVPPTTVSGTADVLTLASKLAKTMGYNFEGNNVSVKLSNPYLHGTAISQMRQLIEAAGLQWIIDQNNTLAIWKPGVGRQGSTPDIYPPPGPMVGYPAFNQNALLVSALYTPARVCGQTVKVQSEFTAACGKWTINKMGLELESLVPRGKWFMNCECTLYNEDTLAGTQ